MKDKKRKIMQMIEVSYGWHAKFLRKNTDIDGGDDEFYYVRIVLWVLVKEPDGVMFTAGLTGDSMKDMVFAHEFNNFESYVFM